MATKTPSSPYKGVAVIRTPRAPVGRTIELVKPVAELVAMVAAGTMCVGEVIGSCSSNCGDIKVKRAGPTASFPEALYGSCEARSEAKHQSFFWLQGVLQPEGRALFPEELHTPHVPRALAKGLCP